MIIVDKLPSVIIATHFPSIKAKSQSRFNPLGKQTLGLAETRRRFQGALRSVVESFESAGRLKTGGICAERGERACGLPTAPRKTQRSPRKSRRKSVPLWNIFFLYRQLFFVAHSLLQPPGIFFTRITSWKWDLQRDLSRAVSARSHLQRPSRSHESSDVPFGFIGLK